MMKTLDPILLPLNQSNLIEASAGTGKTYTIANLYLRLILGVGCMPLTVEQILVVTFTKAATQELRDRIRAKLGQVANYFQAPESDEAKRGFEKDKFLHELYLKTEKERAKSILRLRIAERDMDLASIFTIDSFCQKMLFQYAFDSGVRFDLDLLTDEQDLLIQLSEIVWREKFYPADLAKTTLVAQILRNPSDALELVRNALSGILPPLSADQQQWLKADNSQKIADYFVFLQQVKDYWLAHSVEMVSLISENLSKLNGNSYKADYLIRWNMSLTAWAQRDSTQFPPEYLDRFSQSFLSNKVKKNQTSPSAVYFEQIEEFIQHFNANFANLENQVKTQIVYDYFEALRQKLHDYKQTHTEKNFTDMLTYFHQALMGEKGVALAEKIRQQFQFAMIDESQDTNQVQYEIFSRIFVHTEQPCGFIMIGDPKQSIYKFRGADIFSYLNAAKQVTERFTMERNWRSLPKIVTGINQLFRFPSGDKSPFLYEEIAFQAVKYKESETRLLDKHQEWNLYLQPEAYNRGHLKTDLVAEQCAHQIQQQLNRAAQGELFICEEKEQESEQGLQKIMISRPLEAQDIAILVRSHTDAQRIKQALAKRQIQSVYLSEDNSVYASQEARDLAFVLTACLYPYQQKALLAALATPLWGLSSNALYQLKNSENEWENYVEEFIGYQQLWQMQGILPMLHQLMLKQKIIQRLHSTSTADRRITNLLHLSELLQQAQKENENEFALLRWFQQQIDRPNGGDEQVLRLESEEKLIKIITIHKSKGLEYPVVWLPFIAKKSLGAQSEAISFYRDEQHQLRWDFNSGDEYIKALKNHAEYAEDLRLLYVALTRAKYQLHLILPTQFPAQWNAFNYLLNNGNIDKETDTVTAFLAKGISAAICELEESIPSLAYYSPNVEDDCEKVICARKFERTIYSRGLITSFSTLKEQHKRLQNIIENPALGLIDSAKDYDVEHTEIPMEQSENGEVQFTPADFPQGAKVGNLLHAYFEGWDFKTEPDIEVIGQLCEKLNLTSEWKVKISDWFKDIINTPLTESVCLAEIDSEKRLNEWPFFLRLRNEKALPQLNQLLKKESRLGKNLPELYLKQLEGFIKGFVDLIFEHNGKFYIVDYKSNYLGPSEHDYQQESLEKVMIQQRYDLQYLFYTLALHRYLNSRLGKHYDYEYHFGGVAYLFLRGMNGNSNNGVYFDKPNKILIEKIDRLFEI